MICNPLLIAVFNQCQVSRGLSDYPLLFALMRVVHSLLQNPHIHIEPYVSVLLFILLGEPCILFTLRRLLIFFFLFRQLHQLMPSVVTCLVAKRLGNRFADNHWELRDFTANLVASICKRLGLLRCLWHLLLIF